MKKSNILLVSAVALALSACANQNTAINELNSFHKVVKPVNQDIVELVGTRNAIVVGGQKLTLLTYINSSKQMCFEYIQSFDSLMVGDKIVQTESGVGTTCADYFKNAAGNYVMKPTYVLTSKLSNGEVVVEKFETEQKL